jgi:uncharacterized FAD-dependent dehydrogenase
MILQVDYRLLPEFIDNETVHRRIISEKINLPPEDFDYKIIRRNIDARKQVEFVLHAEVYVSESLSERALSFPNFKFKDVHESPEVHIIGAGPCGYFAALECLLLGLKPILIERGKNVQERRRDLRILQQEGIVHPDSNYCFGEGGAGTYSDGKLYTRSNKRGDIRKVLQLLVSHGALEDILVDVHPHIGSNKLPKIIERIRHTIETCGGRIYFEHRVLDFKIKNRLIKEIICNKSSFTPTQVVLATGHSARDIYGLLQEKNVFIEPKDFALGVRVEHPQILIDRMQYRQNPRHKNLPPATYSLSCNVDQKGVFSFCMCPGGMIVPAATAPGEIVVNGMSLSRRDSPFANSGFVTSINQEDYLQFNEHIPIALRAMKYQQNVEQKMFQAGDQISQAAPAQKLKDFLNRKLSPTLPNSSYIPGIFPATLHELLPKPVTFRLQEALKYFSKKMKYYISDEAILVGTESRTSAPVRIPRDPLKLNHPQILNLFPAGEGAGYAGGILSAAMDGQRVISQIHGIVDANIS